MSNQSSISSMCENCRLQPKFQQRTLAKTVEHPFCGTTCKNEHARRQAARIQLTRRPNNNNNSNGRSGLLEKLDASYPTALRVLEQFLGKWDDGQKDEIRVQGIYRINQQEKYTRRFDDAIIMNDEPSQITACYYGTQILCDDITNCDENAGPCGSNDCSICLAIRFAFEEQPGIKRPSSEGVYGPGLYTCLSPAKAHSYTSERLNAPCRVLVQCRVIVDSLTQGGPSKPFSAITDATGRVFCQKEAIVPTHLVVYIIKGSGVANGSNTRRAGTQNRG